ncbi:putative membrane protein [Desulfosporosinus acidiphilus SJ4]|uniref:Putative membrane protein n=1 Tax=Desulfosporosinus acidiphilus (strain DSM 22704 / JCM 16185 / SJ4) TaxID=646529 RepID=I4D7J7_DESAJ|nr:GtrA family protein [Desulfosporosinus acidiphilus]AFM41771.1 putative membrane protein [Desulfosporosinus acidiphilus SJ4]
MVKITKRQLEFLRFCAVGGINTGIDFGVFAVLFAWGVPLLPAHTFSYSCGIVNSFWLNRRWTFKSKAGGFSPDESGTGRSFKQILQFLALNIMTLALTYGLLIWVHNNWGWPMIASRLFAVGASLAINFLGSRLWVFRQPRLSPSVICQDPK